MRRTIKPKSFTTELHPFADLYSKMYHEIFELLESKTDEELLQIINYTSEVSQRNCWWCTYEVAPIVRGEAKIILQSRKSEGISHD